MRSFSAPDTAGAALRLALAALLLGISATAIGRTFLFVVLPPLGRHLGFSDIQTGAVLSVAAILVIVVAPLWGAVTERIGRRPVLLLGFASVSLAPAAIGWVVAARLEGTVAALTALVLIGAIRFCQAALAGGLLPAAQAYMADVTPPERRVQGMGMLGAAFGVGAIVGPALAWRLGGDQVVTAFVLIGVLAAGGFLSACYFLSEPVRPVPHLVRSAAIPFRQVWPFFFITFCSITTYGVVQQVTALRLQDTLGLSFQEAITRAGSALMLTSLMMVCVQALLVRGLRWPPERLLLLGAVGALLGMLGLAVASQYNAIVAAMVVFGGSLGLVFPGNLASLSVRTGEAAQGKTAGINAMGQGLGGATSPLLGATLHQLAPVAPYVVMSGFLVLVILLALLGSRLQRPDTGLEG
ncbi:MAG: MFS transporter [Candidatus Tectimicrobiota bacterium]